nr:hypothetical protein [Tanacetum cinerariifolium]
MSTRSSARNLFPPLDNPKVTIRGRSRSDPTLLNNSEMVAEGPGDLPDPDLRTMEELCQPSLNVQNSFQFHGLPGDDGNKHLDQFLHVTQSIKVNGVTDDALRLYLFPHSLTHHATAWFDPLPRNSINTFEHMAKMFLMKYFPPSIVTKLRNEITNFRHSPDESLFEAWERYKLLIDRCPNHNMFPVTQIDTFYNDLTLRHRDTINAAAGGTFMKSESSNSITSSSDTEIAALKVKMAKINKNLMIVLQVNQQVKAVTLNYETCGGPHSFFDCLATVGNTQNVYASGAYQGFNQNQNRNNQNQNRNQGNHNPHGNNQGRNQFFQGANQGQNQPLAYEAPAYQAPIYQALFHQPQILQPQVVTTNEFTNFTKANDAILKNIQTNMTSFTNSNLELKNMFGQFMKMNTASSLGSGTLPGNTNTNQKEDLKGITTRSGTVYLGPTIPTTISSSSLVVEGETEETKDTMHPTNNRSTEDVQPPIVNQQVKAVTPKCETCGGPHSFNDCPSTIGNTQNVYAAGAYQGIKETIILRGTTREETDSSRELTKIPQPQAVTTNEFTNFMKANDAILKNMQTNMTSLINSNLELKNMFGQFMKMNTASSSGSETLPGNTLTNPKEDLKGITTRSENAYQGPMIPTTSSSPVVERETGQLRTRYILLKTEAQKTSNLRLSSLNLQFLTLSKLFLQSLSLRPNQRPSIPYPSRLLDQKLRDKANEQ